MERAWTSEDKDFILKNKDTMTDADIAKLLGRSVGSVGGMRRKLAGLKRKHWTKELVK